MMTESTILETVGAKPVFRISAKTLRSIIDTVGDRRAECGGPLGGSAEKSGLVTHFHLDAGSARTAATYSPDHRSLNRLFTKKWNPAGVRLRGFVHSHPGRLRSLSWGDLEYGERILQGIDDMEQLFLPIVNTFPDTGEFRLTPWAMIKSRGRISTVRAAVMIVDADASNRDASDKKGLNLPSADVLLDEVIVTRTSAQPKHHGRRSVGPGLTFDRVSEAYDLDRLAKSRIVAVGAGGAASFLEECARAGVGQFVLIDPDTVSETNLATQQVYRRDIGRSKVKCLAERIQDINPTAKVATIPRSLDDLTDDAVRRLCRCPLPLGRFSLFGAAPLTTILCGFTDSFPAQARVNRLALTIGVPSLCAQVYHQGRGAEVTFTYPGVTPACHRCALSSRYANYSANEGRDNVTSHGTPIFATTRLNAIKGFVLLAMLHHGTDHPRWGRALERIGKRNLVQVRMDPDLGSTLGLTVFDRVFAGADQQRLFFDEVVWLPQEPDGPGTNRPPCPDCGGTSDLQDSEGAFQDTCNLVEERSQRN